MLDFGHSTVGKGFAVVKNNFISNGETNSELGLKVALPRTQFVTW